MRMKKIEKSKKNPCYVIPHRLVVLAMATLVLASVFAHLFSNAYGLTYSSINQSSALTGVKGAESTTISGKVNNTEVLILMVNFERIGTQLALAEKSLIDNNRNDAFAHAYLVHSVIFPSIKSIVDRTGNTNLANQFLSASTDFAFGIQTGSNSNILVKDLRQANEALVTMNNQLLVPIMNDNGTLLIQSSIALLNDANKSYVASNPVKSGRNAIDIVNYQNALAFTNTSRLNYNSLSSDNLDKNKKAEIDLSYNQLERNMNSKASAKSVSLSISELQSRLASILSPSSNASSSSNLPSAQLQYFTTIRSDFQEALKDIKNGNYQGADDTIVSAYLDNFEYLEPAIDNLDHKLKLDIELSIREHLRQMITAKMLYNQINSFMDGILLKLNQAQELLSKHAPPPAGPNSNSHINSTTPSIASVNGKALANIQGLSQGFGVYTGVRHSMGQTSESSKGMVRTDTDRIRMELDNMLQLYQKGIYDQAFSTSRSAYLDNFENIELPLRPINPDFTLDMEIKFAQLRNLIETKAPYQQVLSQTVEIRQGLDEAEREVSGTGVVAPAISFSGSFSIIFREGLESALIISAILTYIEASRNERFKKHVYLGIVIAIAATAVTWFIAQYIIEISGANRELIEAIAGLSAVGVLFWVSFWVLNKIETKKWIEFVKAKVWKATTTGSVVVFAMLSFFTVYREGFETVLFYQALLSYAKYMEWYVIIGFISGLATILVIVYIIRKLGKKLPLRLLFAVTMGVGAYMSIVFIGNAVRSFQELGLIPTTPMIGVIPRLDINVADMTGIHPTLESVVAQLILLSIYVVGSLYILSIQPRRKRMIEISRKSMAERKGGKEEGQT